MTETLWQKLTALCEATPDGVYTTNWDTFYQDTGGFTINSLVQWHKEGRIRVSIERDGGTYHISMVKEQVDAR